jgi:hypothetical protein
VRLVLFVAGFVFGGEVLLCVYLVVRYLWVEEWVAERRMRRAARAYSKWVQSL